MTKYYLTLLEEKNYAELKEKLIHENPVDIASLFEKIENPEQYLKLFRLLPKNVAAEAFAYLETDSRKNLIDAMTDKELSYILNDLFLDDCVDLVEEMPANVVTRLMKNADQQTRALINRFLKYPEDSAGSVMTIEFVSLRPTMTIQQAFNHIRQTGVDKETIYTCYVTENRILEGFITVKDMLLSNPEDLIGSKMNTHVISVGTLDDKEHIAKLVSKYDIMSLPVVDNEGRLVGIVTFDDAMDVLQEENTEDFVKMALVAPDNETYLRISVIGHAKRRILWLMILMLSATITGLLITYFENELMFGGSLILVSFIPMLMDTGGNCGSQSSTLIIRGMALDEIKSSDFLKVWSKEVRIALTVGVALAIVNAFRILIQYRGTEHIGLIALTVGLAMIITILISKSLGCILPMFAKKTGLDPAIMAAPLITTITDAASIFFYVMLARYLLKG
ncbi:MAG TPA: magnesium transporter [Clostridiales bacterium]|nr:magnesium transporter [Clostridiales bacterium]HCG36086.1 magnesium transporter [Clostridiales bacterium]